MKTLKCPVCKGNMEKIKDKIVQDQVEFEAYKCIKCKEELIDLDQLKKLVGKYRELRKSKEVVFSKWGNSIAIRIPSEYVEALQIYPGKKGFLTKTEKEIKITPI